MKSTPKLLQRTTLLLVLSMVAAGCLPPTLGLAAAAPYASQSDQRSFTPLQAEIERQRQRLGSTETEERRDAVTRLGSMHHPSAARAVLAALQDSSAMVRATAAAAILSLPSNESAGYLIPLLADKDEFVRREVAFALGKTQSQTAVGPLIERLNTDKKDSVRGAAAVALGELKDPSAVYSLAQILAPGFAAGTSGSKKSRKEKDLFLLRAAARSLGQIRSSVGLPALVAAMQDEKASDDVRRESAYALGLIADAAALPALRGVLNARDPYLAEAALESIRKIERSTKTAHGN